MGSMSASDAAPLPRLGEVFFDVRGNSRSMRLSWYADTGVAVFSIWQGGMCTGTFRLAIADLPRMVETLQRGPGGRRAGWDADGPGHQAFANRPAEGAGDMRAMGPLPGQMPPDSRADQPDYRTGTHEYLSEPPAQRAGARDYPAGLPDGPSPGPESYGTGARDYLADPPGQRAGSTDYLADPPGQRTRQTDYLADPPGQRTRQTDYLADPPGQRAGQTDYLADPPGQRAGQTDYLADPPGHRAGSTDYLADPPGQRTRQTDYLADPPGHRAGSTDYLADPPGQRAGSTDYLTGPSDYPERPPEQRTEYLAGLPAGGADPAGYGGGFPPGSGPGAWNPGAGDSGAYPHEAGRQAGYPGETAGDPYLGGTGPADYRGEPRVPHYPGGSSDALRGDAPGPSSADYPAHYGTAVPDDIGDEPSADSFPYGRRPDGR